MAFTLPLSSLTGPHETAALEALRDKAAQPHIEHANPEAWTAPPGPDRAALHDQLETWYLTRLLDPPSFPTTVNLRSILVETDEAMETQDYVNRTLEVPTSLLHRLGPADLARAAAALAAADLAWDAEETPSPVLADGWRITCTTDLGNPLMQRRGENRFELRIDHRRGQVHACTVIDRAAPQLPPAFVVFDPDPPGVRHAPPAPRKPTQFIAQLPSELWLHIRDLLDERDQIAMWEVDTAAHRVFQPPLMAAREAVQRLIQEVQSGRPQLDKPALAQATQALEDSALTADQLAALLEPLKVPLTTLITLSTKWRTGDPVFVQRVARDYPKPVIELYEHLRAQVDARPAQ